MGTVDWLYVIKENIVFLFAIGLIGIVFGLFTRRERDFFKFSVLKLWPLALYPGLGLLWIVINQRGTGNVVSIFWSLFYGSIEGNEGAMAFYGVGLIAVIPMLFFGEAMRFFFKGKIGFCLETLFALASLYSLRWVELPLGIQYSGVVSLGIRFGIFLSETTGGLKPLRNIFWTKDTDKPWALINEDRDLTMDMAKGLAILLMIYDHVKMTGAFITSFHMPLFFIVSGYFLKDGLSIDTVKKRTKGLLVPYVKYSMVSWSATCFYSFYFEHHSLEKVGDLLMEQIKDTLLGQNLYLLWFLVALYLAGLFYSGLLFLLRNHHLLLWAAVILSAVFGYELYRYDSNVIWYCDLAFVGVFFLHVGKMYHPFEKQERWKRYGWLCLFAVLWYFGIRNGGIVMGLRLYPYFPYCVISAVAGTFVVIECCRYLKVIPYVKEVVVYCGQHTLQILCITNVIRKLVDWQSYCNGVSVWKQFFLQILVVAFYLILMETGSFYMGKKKGHIFAK